MKGSKSAVGQSQNRIRTPVCLMPETGPFHPVGLWSFFQTNFRSGLLGFVSPLFFSCSFPPVPRRELGPGKALEPDGDGGRGSKEKTAQEQAM